MRFTHLCFVLHSFFDYNLFGLSLNIKSIQSTVRLNIRKLLISSVISVSTSTFSPHESLAVKLPLDPNPVFFVEKATTEDLNKLKVQSWSTWSSNDSPSYAIHKLKNKVYQTNEICYIDKGKFQITPEETGRAIIVSAGDFVMFPKNFKCTWDVEEPVFKHWFEY